MAAVGVARGTVPPGMETQRGCLSVLVMAWEGAVGRSIPRDGSVVEAFDSWVCPKLFSNSFGWRLQDGVSWHSHRSKPCPKRWLPPVSR